MEGAACIRDRSAPQRCSLKLAIHCYDDLGSVVNVLIAASLKFMKSARHRASCGFVTKEVGCVWTLWISERLLASQMTIRCNLTQSLHVMQVSSVRASRAAGPCRCQCLDPQSAT